MKTLAHEEMSILKALRDVPRHEQHSAAHLDSRIRVVVEGFIAAGLARIVAGNVELTDAGREMAK